MESALLDFRTSSCLGHIVIARSLVLRQALTRRKSWQMDTSKLGSVFSCYTACNSPTCSISSLRSYLSTCFPPDCTLWTCLVSGCSADHSSISTTYLRKHCWSSSMFPLELHISHMSRFEHYRYAKPRSTEATLDLSLSNLLTTNLVGGITCIFPKAFVSETTRGLDSWLCGGCHSRGLLMLLHHKASSHGRRCCSHVPLQVPCRGSHRWQ